MREMAKAMLRFSWAMSVFGLEQVGKLVSEEDEGHREERIKAAFDSVSAAARRELKGRAKSVYEAGERLQAESVDLVFDLARPGNWKPEKVVDQAVDLIEHSADALRDIAHTKAEGGRKKTRKAAASDAPE